MTMKALIYNNHKIKLAERKMPEIIDPRDAIVKVGLSSICTSDLHICMDLCQKQITILFSGMNLLEK